MADTVNFDSQGSWTVGDGPSEMDVGKKGGRAKDKSESKGGTGKGVASSKDTATPTAKPTGSSGALDLAALKRKAGGMKAKKAKTSTDVEKTKEDVKVPQEEPVEKPVEKPVDMVEPAVPAEAPKQEDVTEIVADVPETSETSGSVAPSQEEPARERSALDLKTVGSTVKKMELDTAGVQLAAEAAEEPAAGKAPANGVTAEKRDSIESTPSTSAVADGNTPVAAPPKFNIVSLEEFTQYASERQLYELGRRAIKYFVRHPTAVVAFSDVANVRVYCAVPTSNGDSLVCFGVGATVTLVRLDFDKSSITENTRSLQAQGNFVMIDDAPVAHTGQVVAEADVI